MENLGRCTLRKRLESFLHFLRKNDKCWQKYLECNGKNLLQDTMAGSHNSPYIYFLVFPISSLLLPGKSEGSLRTR